MSAEDIIDTTGKRLAEELYASRHGAVAYLLVAFDAERREWSISSNIKAESLLPFLDDFRRRVAKHFDAIEAVSGSVAATEKRS